MNVKFVSKNSRQSETLMETMTPGRIYAVAGGNDINEIMLFDNQNKRNKVLERDKRTGVWHVHYGYEHGEYGHNLHEPLSEADQRMIDRSLTIWKNRNRTSGRTGVRQP